MGRIMSELLQKITDVKVWHIRVPVVSTRSHGIGDIEGGFEVVLLRLTTEGGQEGWGEAACRLTPAFLTAFGRQPQQHNLKTTFDVTYAVASCRHNRNPNMPNLNIRDFLEQF